MNQIFQSFLKRGYRYNYTNGPDIIRDEDHGLQEGLNCIALMHLLLKRLFQIDLPSNIRVLEMYHPNPYFQTVHTLDELEIGDIVFFGPLQLPEYIHNYHPKFDDAGKLVNEDEGKAVIGDKHAGYHTVMYVGEKEKGEPLFIHIGSIDNAVSIWPLSKFKSMEKYKHLYTIKRFKEKN